VNWLRPVQGTFRGWLFWLRYGNKVLQNSKFYWTAEWLHPQELILETDV